VHSGERKGGEAGTHLTNPEAQNCGAGGGVHVGGRGVHSGIEGATPHGGVEHIDEEEADWGVAGTGIVEHGVFAHVEAGGR